ncbi:MAG: ATP-grasp fold amidoligase family protein [Advenella sp.]|nr:ATP-grasp fold amidoligase family protein [Advenella sp.]
MSIKTLKQKTKTVINNPKVLFIKLLYKISPLFSDKIYLKILFPLQTGYKLNLDKPKTYNEKLQWLKIHYRKPIMMQMVDKYEAKKFAQNIIGKKYIIENLGIWDSFDEIDFNSLPNRFVLKTTHDQGGIIIVKDKNKLDIKAAKIKINKHLKTKHFYLTREWPYKDVKPRIMAEVFLENKNLGDLWDYKFYCFHGIPEVMYIAHGRHSEQCYFDFFDMNFNKLDIARRGYSQSKKTFDIPKNWDLMKELAAKLSKNLPHVRVDFYNIDGLIYLGELTFFQGGGMMPFYPKDWDLAFGNWININNI